MSKIDNISNINVVKTLNQTDKAINNINEEKSIIKS